MFNYKLEVGALGHLNIVLSKEACWSEFLFWHKEIIEQFAPLKVDCCEISYPNYDTINVSSLVLPNDNNILICSYHNINKEQVQLSYFKSRVMLEHMHTASYVHMQNGSGAGLVKQFFDTTKKNLIIIGFEISISIENYYTSIENNVNDKSLYPIVIIDKNQDTIKKQLYFINNMDKNPIDIIESYINQLKLLEDYTNL